MRRVFLCPGPTQLITAVAAADCLESGRGRDWRGDDNHLVVDTLLTPGEESGRFAELVKLLANQLHRWSSVSYLAPQVNLQLADEFRHRGAASAVSKLRGEIGLKQADAVFLCCNWTFNCELFLSAYKSAEKISYGDGFGIYSPRPAVASGPRPRFARLKNARRALRKIGESAGLLRPKHPELPRVEFDAGCFATFATMQGMRIPMPSQLVAPRWPLQVLRQLTGLIPSSLVRELRAAALERPCVFLLGENLTEAGEMTESTEIRAWCELLELHRIDARATIVYKPHPRDNLDKVARLAAALRKAHAQVMVLNDEGLARLPIELLLLAAFPTVESRRQARVVTTGSSVVSLKFYFDFDAHFGWGPLLCEQTGFSARFVEGNREFARFVQNMSTFLPRHVDLSPSFAA